MATSEQLATSIAALDTAREATTNAPTPRYVTDVGRRYAEDGYTFAGFTAQVWRFWGPCVAQIELPRHTSASQAWDVACEMYDAIVAGVDPAVAEETVRKKLDAVDERETERDVVAASYPV